MDCDHLQAEVQARGLALRGAFHPEAGDGVPPLPDGRPAATLALIGSVGGSLWEPFRSSPESALTDSPLDTWTRRIAGELADVLGAAALFPFGGPPYFPFQRWAQRAGSVHTSPLGLLIHSDYGLWHAYRAALILPERITLPEAPVRRSPCETCTDKPCLSLCPVGAFSSAGYDVPRCVAHISRAENKTCLERACLARRACPVGRAYAYGPEQARFHMRAFRRAHQT